MDFTYILKAQSNFLFMIMFFLKLLKYLLPPYILNIGKK